MPVCLGLQTHWSINCTYSITHARDLCPLLQKFIPSQEPTHTALLSWTYARIFLTHSQENTNGKWNRINKHIGKYLVLTLLICLICSCLQECKGGAELPTLPVYRVFKKIFIFFLELSLLPKMIWLSRTGFPSQTISTHDLKSKREDIYKNTRETKSSGNSTLNKSCLSVPNSSVQQILKYSLLLGKRKKRKTESRRGSLGGEAEQLQNKSIWQW